jgi:hypothetical protein
LSTVRLSVTCVVLYVLVVPVPFVVSVSPKIAFDTKQNTHPFPRPIQCVLQPTLQIS